MSSNLQGQERNFLSQSLAMMQETPGYIVHPPFSHNSPCPRSHPQEWKKKTPPQEEDLS